jgi:type I restriction enzyme S subunit
MSSKVRSSTATGAESGVGPKLRFPEFQNAKEWRIKKLNSLLYEAKHRNRSLELGPTDVLSVSGEHGCVNQIEFMGRSYAGVTVKDYHVVEHGDIVYTKSPLKRNPYGIIKENKGKRGIVSTLYAVYRPFADSSATYLDHFFSVDYNLNAYLQPIVRKGPKNDMKVNNADVLKGNICVPPLPEQEKIADCLASADALIAAQGRKVEALRAHKKGLMQKLFPQEGETQPRLRFSEFRDAEEWGSKTLTEVATYENGKAYEQDIVENGKYIVVNSRFISTEGAVRKYTNADYLTANTGDVLMVLSDLPRGRALAKCYFVEPDNRYAVNQRVCRLKGKRVDPKFLFFILDRNSNLLAYDDGQNQTHLSKDSVLECPLCIPPTKDEQKRIADCLTSLDDLIAAETRKLDTLKTHKKGLMQQLFPQVGETDA